MSTVSILVASALALVSALGLVLLPVHYRSELKLRRNGVAATARIVRLKPRHSRQSVPVFAFVLDGKTFEVSAQTAIGGFGRYREGDAVAIRCLPADPAGARIDRASQLWADTLTSLGLAILGAMAAAVVIVGGRAAWF